MAEGGFFVGPVGDTSSMVLAGASTDELLVLLMAGEPAFTERSLDLECLYEIRHILLNGQNLASQPLIAQWVASMRINLPESGKQ